MKRWVLFLVCLMTFTASFAIQYYRIWTKPFDIIYQEGLEDFALQLYHEGPGIYQYLCDFYGFEPHRRVRVYLVDDGDYANAYADIFSHMTAIYVSRSDTRIGKNHYQWWVPYVFAHELTHILIADKPGVLKDQLRIFGNPVATLFDTAFTPSWMHEGGSIVSETLLFDQGRLHDSRFEMFLRAAILDERFRGLQLAGGMQTPVYTPVGDNYLYGAFFFAFMIDRFGIEAYRAFFQTYGTQYRYNLFQAIKGVTGMDWADFLIEWAVWVSDRVKASIPDPIYEGQPVQKGRTHSGTARLFGNSVVVIDRPDQMLPRWLQIEPDGTSRVFRLDPTPIDFDISPAGRVAAVYGFGDGLEQYSQELFLEDDHGVLRKASEKGRVIQVRWLDESTILYLKLDKGGTSLMVHTIDTSKEVTLMHGNPDFWINGISVNGPRIGLSITFNEQTHLYLWEDGALICLHSSDHAMIDPFLTESSLFFSWDLEGIYQIYSIDLNQLTFHQHTSVQTGAFQPLVVDDRLYYRGYDSFGYALYVIPYCDKPLTGGPPLCKADGITESDFVLPVRSEYMIDAELLAQHSVAYAPSIEPRAWSPLVLAGGAIAPGIGVLGWDDLKQNIFYGAVGTYGSEFLWELIFIERGSPVNIYLHGSGNDHNAMLQAQLAIPLIERSKTDNVTIYPHLGFLSLDLLGTQSPEKAWVSMGIDLGFGVIHLPNNPIAVNSLFASFLYEKGMGANVGKGFVLPFESLGIGYLRIHESSSPVVGLSVWTPLPVSAVGTSEGKFQFQGCALRSMLELTPRYPYIAGGIGFRFDFQVHYWLQFDLTIDIIASAQGINPVFSIGSGGFFMMGVNPNQRPEHLLERSILACAE